MFSHAHSPPHMNRPSGDIATAVLAGLHQPPALVQDARESLDELAFLAKTLGVRVIHQTLQTRPTPDPATYLGSGKLEEITSLLSASPVDVIIFDNELSPRQGQHLEHTLGCMVWDRTQLILEIFARQARTAESRLQVECARLHYQLPRLVGLWSHLDRERGGISASRGTGEKQITLDRQTIRRRIRTLEQALKKISLAGDTRKKRRARCGQVCLIGYTNAGKSTLMNILTGSDVPVADRLFATLDSTTRVLTDSVKPALLLSDTVGFIHSLPHSLVASFRSTLAVVRDADLLVQVVDAGHPGYLRHIRTTVDVLNEIGAGEIPRLLVFNKADLLPSDISRIIIEKKFPGSVLVSAFDPDAQARLLAEITSFFQQHLTSRTIRVPYSQSERLAWLYARGIVSHVDFREDAAYVECALSAAENNRLAGLLQDALCAPAGTDS